jgi:hypothetical protein
MSQSGDKEKKLSDDEYFNPFAIAALGLSRDLPIMPSREDEKKGDSSKIRRITPFFFS